MIASPPPATRRHAGAFNPGPRFGTSQGCCFRSLYKYFQVHKNLDKIVSKDLVRTSILKVLKIPTQLMSVPPKEETKQPTFQKPNSKSPAGQKLSKKLQF